MTAQIITFGNFKGGTGKTTNATLSGLALARAHYKTLLIDMDPQGNATDIYFKTAGNLNNNMKAFDMTLLKAIQEEDLSGAVVKLDKNIDFLPSSVDFSYYPRYLEDKFKDSYEERVQYFSTLLSELQEKYDYILLDLPPTISLITDSALYASDWVIVVMQTQEHALQGAVGFIDYMQSQIIDSYHAPKLQFLGILPVLLKNGSPVDKNTLHAAEEEFGKENMFNTLIRSMERIKRYSIGGVISRDQYDRRVRYLYNQLVKEITERTQEGV
jgi:ATPases involved in chromosome partitioning